MDFFGSKKEEQPKTPTVNIQKTGKFIDALVTNLLGVIHDRNEDTRDQMMKSLKDIGDRHPEMVISSCCNFLQTNSISTDHRITILTVMKHIVDDNRQSISKSLALSTMGIAFAEMVQSKEIKPEWQGASSSLLVSFGIDYGAEVLDHLKKHLDPGVMPHFFIVKTLGDFAVANPIYFVPNSKEIFGRITSLLGQIKHDNLRWVFAATIGHFCEAIINFLANAGPEIIASTGITMYSFSGEVFSAYEMMTNQWLNKNESQLRLTIVQALGFMAQTMQRDLLEGQIAKMINVVLALYKREKNHLPITHGLTMILDVAVADESRILDPLLQVLLSNLHALVATSADFSAANANVMKNYNELLRCFEIISKTFSDHVVNFLLKTFESREEKARIATLNIFKHLINSSDKVLADKKELILSGLKPLLSEPNTKVRKSFSQVVITLASHDYLRLEGGHILVEFIVRQSSISQNDENAFQKSKPQPDSVTPFQLRSMCDNILSLLTTTIPEMEQVLWPYLFEHLIPAQYTESLSVVCKNLAHLACKKRESESDDYMIDFDRLVNVPKPHSIMSRLLVVLSQPEERPQLGENVLNFLKAIGPVLHPSICDLWDDIIPKLLVHLKEKSGDSRTWVQSKWEDYVLKLLIKTIEEVNDDEWNTQLGEEMCNQFNLYAQYPNYKSMLYKTIGVVLQRSGKKSFVRDKLDYILNVVDHTKAEDRLGCAIGLGYCANTHLDVVIDKLQGLLNPAQKKSSGFFSFGSDKSDKDIEMTKCTVMLCYGYAAAKADLSLIKSRLEVNIVNQILPHFNTAKSLILKEHIIRCIDLLGKTMNPKHLGSEYHCSSRKPLLQILIKYLTTEAKGENSNEIRTLCLQACATLVLLDPPLPQEEEVELISKSLAVYMKIPATEQATLDSLKDDLDVILRALFEKTPSTKILARNLEHFSKYLSDKTEEIRKRSIQFVYSTIENFHDACLSLDPEAETKPEIDAMVIFQWIAALIPRCTDPNEEVRVASIECIGKLIEIKGVGSEVSEELVEKISSLSDRITTPESNAQFAVVHDVARSLSPEISESELYPFLEVILKGLFDNEASSASGTCIVLNAMIRIRGTELGSHVSQIVSLIYTAMKGIQNEQTMNGALHSLKTLSSHHLQLVATEILNFDIPHDEFVKKIIHALAKDPKLGDQLMKHCTDLLNTSQPYTETLKRKDEYQKEATKQTVNATLTLSEMFEVTEITENVKQYLPILFSTALLRIGSVNGIDKKHSFNRNITEDAVKMFENLLIRIEDEDITKVLTSELKAKLNETEFYDGIFDISTALFKGYEELMKEVTEFLAPYLSHNFNTQRITVAAIFSSFISCCEGNVELLTSLINSILVRLGDTDFYVKILVLRGLGNVADCGEEEVNRYSTTILSALMQGMEDAKAEKPEIILEALNGLSKVMKIVNGTSVVAILVTICIKLRPYFETENADIRKAAIVLFGNLHRFGEGPCKTVFYEQIQTNFVTLLVHLNEDDHSIRNATKKTLTQLGPLFQSEDINEFFQQTLSEEKNVQYGEFIHKITKYMIAYFSRNLGNYLMDGVNFFKSNWATIRANAAMFTGFLLGNLPRESRKAINVDHLCSALTALLKNDDPVVRKKSAEAISLLYDY